MQTTVNYSDFLDDVTGKQVIKSISTTLGVNAKLDLEVKEVSDSSVPPVIAKKIELKMSDVAGLNTVSDTISKGDAKEFLEIFKMMFTQF